MQKNQKKTKKTSGEKKQVIPAQKTQKTHEKSEPAEKEIDEKKVTSPLKEAEQRQEKSILKPFFFFAVFIAFIGAGMLYPYFKKPEPFPVMPSREPSFAHPFVEEVAAQTKKIEEPEIIEVETTSACAAKDKLILSQKQTINELNEKIHRLEMEALNMSEKMNASVKTTPLSIRLMEELYAGKPFSTTLNALLMTDKNNPLTLMVKEKLEPFALSGIPTPESLEKMFLKQMDIAEKTFYISKNSSSWNEQMWSYFKSLIHVYPQNMDIEKTSGVSLLFLARNQVLNDDFTSALRTIDKMPLSVQQMLTPFVQNASRYLEAQNIINAYLQN